MQVGPAVGAAVQADGQVLEALRIHLLHRVLHDGLGVFELDGRQAALVVAAVVAAIAGLGDRAQEGVDGVADVGGIDFVRVGEVGRAHQAVALHARLAREVVEHQHALAQARGADLEAGAVGGERVRRGPGSQVRASCRSSFGLGASASCSP